MTHLSGQQHDLPAMVPLVRHQVSKDMHDIYGQVQPGNSRRRDAAAVLDPELE
jgi:hypothetical protein